MNAVQGNLRDIAASPAGPLVMLAREPAQAALSISGEDEQGDSFEETLCFQGGNFVGCNGAVGDSGTAVARALAALTRPFGFFTFSPGSFTTPSLQTGCPISVTELALEYARAVPEVSELLESFCPPGKVLRLGDSIDRLRAQVKISPAEWKIIFRVNNKRSVEEVATSPGIDATQFARHLFACLVIGAVVPDRSSGSSIAALPPGSMRGDSVSSSSGLQKTPSSSSQNEKQESRGSAGSASGSASASAEGETEVAPNLSGVRPRILAVDDSRTVQRVVQMALSGLNVDIDLADSGEQALEIAAKRKPDLVILDIIMPGMDGYKTCEALRKMLAPARVPVIMLTSKEGALNSLRGRMAGATAYLTKPFEDEELRKAVRDNLRLEK
ncbi:hypothetical protein BH09SUM1_BH09SUM1_31080 [soil metagenome]